MADVKHDDPASEFIPGDDRPDIPETTSVARLSETGLARPGDTVIRTPIKDNTPTVKIVHGVGKLAKDKVAPAGSLVLDDTVVLYEPPASKKGGGFEAEEPVMVTILKVADCWREILPYPWPPDTFPREFQTEKEAIAAGLITQKPPRGSSDWDDPAKKQNCKPAVWLAMLLEEPQGIEDRSYYYVPIAGKWYAPAKMLAETWAYEEVAPVINRASSYSHRMLGLPAATFALTTKTRHFPKSGNFTMVPALRLASTKTEAEIKALYETLGG